MLLATRKPIAEQIFGDNKAPIKTVLDADFAELSAEVKRALSAFKALPAKIKDAADLGVAGEHVIALRKLATQVEGIRKAEGQPLLEATRDLNAFFTGLKAKLDAAKDTLETAATVYQREVEAARRAEANRLAEESRRREEQQRQQAEQAQGVNAARAEGRAEQHAATAERHEQKASASAADLVRTHTATGVTASAKTSWDFVIEDYDGVDLNKLRPYFARADVEKAIRSLVRIQKGSTQLPGVRVFEDTRAAFRK